MPVHHGPKHIECQDFDALTQGVSRGHTFSFTQGIR
jgi:hypothetical protein